MTYDTTGVAPIVPISDIEPVSIWHNRPRKTGKKNPALVALGLAIKAALTHNPAGYIANGVTELQITKGNGKTGWAFTLPEGLACPNKTPACAASCYLGFGAFTYPAAKNSRNRNYAYVVRALKQSTLVAEMTKAIKAKKLKTLRVHDGGDFFSPSYTRAWVEIVRNTPNVSYWGYTRSWATPQILKELLKLGRQPNFALWLSLDQDNFASGLAVYNSNRSSFAGVAFMQLEGDEHLVRMLNGMLPREELVIFPVHKDSGKVQIETVKEAPNCPAIAHSGLPPIYAHDPKKPACLECRKCLPIQGEAA